MSELVVLAEHRDGEVREITLQMLAKASELCGQDHRLTVVLLCDTSERLVPVLQGRADEIVVYEAPTLRNFDPDVYAGVLAGLVRERNPLLLMLGHTAWSMDLAAALAAKTGRPLATDCVDVLLADGGVPKVVRQVYNGKMLVRAAFRPAEGYLLTIRPGSFPASGEASRRTTLTRGEVATPATARRRFIEYRDSGRGEVDITQADVLVSVGRGIGDEESIEPARELAALLGGALSCSRPVVDKKWLPKYHQVGTSGQSVKPKVYLALGISGAFQHLAGISGAGTIIAVNRDRKAPIFRVADYGAVADAPGVVEALKALLRDT